MSLHRFLRPHLGGARWRESGNRGKELAEAPKGLPSLEPWAKPTRRRQWGKSSGASFSLIALRRWVVSKNQNRIPLTGHAPPFVPSRKTQVTGEGSEGKGQFEQNSVGGLPAVAGRAESPACAGHRRPRSRGKTSLGQEFPAPYSQRAKCAAQRPQDAKPMGWER
jgi:hypothetical protein